MELSRLCAQPDSRLNKGYRRFGNNSVLSQRRAPKNRRSTRAQTTHEGLSFYLRRELVHHPRVHFGVEMVEHLFFGALLVLMHICNNKFNDSRRRKTCEHFKRHTVIIDAGLFGATEINELDHEFFEPVAFSGTH
jgi:hypothetical protein